MRLFTGDARENGRAEKICRQDGGRHDGARILRRGHGQGGGRVQHTYVAKRSPGAEFKCTALAQVKIPGP